MDNAKRIIIIVLSVLIAVSVFVIIWSYASGSKKDDTGKDIGKITLGGSDTTGVGGDTEKKPESSDTDEGGLPSLDKDSITSDQSSSVSDQTTKKPGSVTTLNPENTYDDLGSDTEPVTTPAPTETTVPGTTTIIPDTTVPGTTGSDTTATPDTTVPGTTDSDTTTTPDTTKPNSNDGWSPDDL